MSEDIAIYHEKLYEAILSLKSVEECKIFFEDLCTYKEVDAMSQRLESARLLLEGETYEQIIKLTSISSATLSRVSRCVKYGKGYKMVLKPENK